MSETVVYDPTIFFAPRSLHQAQAAILTPEDSTTANRWAKETPYLADLMGVMEIQSSDKVMDFGCGVGRMSKELIARHQCRCFGVDFSPAMRALAAGYVEHPHFLACDPIMMDDLPQMDRIIAVWVIQHIPHPTELIDRLIAKLRPGGQFFLANSYRQVFPISDGRWIAADIGVDVLQIFRDRMTQLSFGPRFSIEHTTPRISEHGWWGVFAKR